MYLILNDNNEIKGVGVSTDSKLRSVYVNEEDNMFFFKNKSEAFMCCYKVNVNSDGIITMATPYVDSNMIPHLDSLGKSIENNIMDINTCLEGIAELYEMLLPEDEEVE